MAQMLLSERTSTPAPVPTTASENRVYADLLRSDRRGAPSLASLRLVLTQEHEARIDCEQQTALQPLAKLVAEISTTGPAAVQRRQLRERLQDLAEEGRRYQSPGSGQASPHEAEIQALELKARSAVLQGDDATAERCDRQIDDLRQRHDTYRTRAQRAEAMRSTADALRDEELFRLASPEAERIAADLEARQRELEARVLAAAGPLLVELLAVQKAAGRLRGDRRRLLSELRGG